MAEPVAPPSSPMPCVMRAAPAPPPSACPPYPRPCCRRKRREGRLGPAGHPRRCQLSPPCPPSTVLAWSASRPCPFWRWEDIIDRAFSLGLARSMSVYGRV